MSHFKIEWVEKYTNSKSVFFDIGSYDGKVSLKFKNFYNNSNIFAFESDSFLFEKMSKNPKLKNIEIINKVVSDIDGEIIFYSNTGKKRGCGSIHEPNERIYKFKDLSFDSGKLTKSTRIDTFCLNKKIEHIDVIHMDVQSAEYEVLLGMGEITCDMIFLEVSALNFYKNSKSTREFLISKNYKQIDISNITKGDELWIKK